ncbi:MULTISPECIES: ROK family transcriptional regulator [unclassified Streptomyces]|uniref:ROK family transcriptional regulator n=1 Tax=unclassified Streptomyces TaxID=2593676 RepID=UPI000DBA3C0E|nr:ROK family transcriptional regulator [Streptomyces sp. PsTaAH-137]MYT74690.1 ROK family protein [Streptomyces sp. SID8367]RAJ91674.1 putative NBD/HSP70 family sugar kinase [Streptomyces sp. PsTaAH-137]
MAVHDRSRGHDLAALRDLNSSVVLRELRRESPRTVSGLAGATGLSRPTVEALVEQLTAQGWIAEADVPATGRAPGRPARRFRFRAEAGHVVGVDVGLKEIVLLLGRLDGQIVARARHRIAREATGAERIELLRGHLRSFLAGQGLGPHDVWSLGVGVPGMVGETGRIRSVIVPDWTDLDLARRLADDFPGTGRILVENDVNLAVLAEHWRGTAQLADDVACVLLGPRISCGLMIDGRLHRGRRGGAGELGYLPQLGLEQVKKGFDRAGERLPGESATDALARAVRTGEAGALDVLDRFLAGVAPAVAALVLALDPELVVLSGPLAPVGDSLATLLSAHLGPLTLHVPRLAISTLGREGVALGAVRRALDAAEARLPGQRNGATD